MLSTMLYNNKELEIFIDESLMNLMNWSWESLLFPENENSFAYVLDKSSKNIMVLTTHGEVRILDTIEGIDISNSNMGKYNHLMDTVKKGEIYCSSRYHLFKNNWFSLDYGRKYNSLNKTYNFEDNEIFQVTPKNSDDLIAILTSYFDKYFMEQ